MLMFCIGVMYVYFGYDEWVVDVLGLKILDDVIVLCCKLLFVFECVEVELDLVCKVVWFSFVVVGGGLIGVELVGMLVEIVCYILCNEFCYIDLVSVKVCLVEVGLCVLFSFFEVLLLKVCCQLEKFGVDVLIGMLVIYIDGEGFQLGDWFFVVCIVVWVVGVVVLLLVCMFDVLLDCVGCVLV